MEPPRLLPFSSCAFSWLAIWEICVSDKKRRRERRSSAQQKRRRRGDSCNIDGGWMDRKKCLFPSFPFSRAFGCGGAFRNCQIPKYLLLLLLLRRRGESSRKRRKKNSIVEERSREKKGEKCLVRLFFPRPRPLSQQCYWQGFQHAGSFFVAGEKKIHVWIDTLG